MPYAIDGSNVGGRLRGARGARDRAGVLELVRRWAGRRRRVVLVFDGPPDEALPDHLGNLEIRYSGLNEADAVILALVRPAARDWRVVTEDRALAARCRELGAEVLDARSLASEAESPDPRPGDEPVDVDDWRRWFGWEGDGGESG